MARTTVNEGSTSYHGLSFLDADGNQVTPESLRYRVTSSTGEPVVDWTTLPTNTVEIELSSTVNTIGGLGKRRFLTIECAHNGGDVITEEIEYRIVDLAGI